MTDRHGEDVVEDLAHLLARFAQVRRATSWDTAAVALPDLHEAATLVQLQQDEPPPRVKAPGALMGWAEARGVRLASALHPTAEGLALAQDVRAGERLLEMPIEATIRSGVLTREHPLLAPWLGDAPLFGPGNLMLWLLACRPDDPDTPYVDALPETPPATALHWPHSPGAHLLAADLGRRFLAGVLQLYCLAYRRLLHTPPDARPLPLTEFTVKRWLWAGSIVSAHQTEVEGDLALVPLLDRLDREGPATARLSLEGGRLRVDTLQDLSVGDRVSLGDGGRSPAQRWVHAGAVPPGPPDGAQARLPFGVPKGVALRREKMIWMLSQPSIPLEVTVGRGALGEALDRARWYALDGDALDRLELSSVADAWGRSVSLDDAHEAQAHALLDRWLLDKAGPPTPEAPFDRAHAFILAAAHARYAGLREGPGSTRLLDDEDAPLVDAALRDPAAPLRLRANLRAAGLIFSGIQHSGTWAGAFDGAALVGLAMHARNDVLWVHGARALDAARWAVEDSRRPVAGLVGPCDDVETLRAALQLRDRPTREAFTHRVLTLDLDALRAPEELADVRSEDGARWQAFVDDTPVATATLGLRIAGAVEVSDVSTGAEHRGRGHARRCIAAALAHARADGVTRATLLVAEDNAAALATYRALGFEDVGSRATVVFASGVRPG